MTITVATVLVLVMQHPGTSGLTSQSISGFSSKNTCQEAATEAVKQKHALAAFCVTPR